MITSLLVSTEFGVGFWDASREELRTTSVVHTYPKPNHMEPVTADLARLFYSVRVEMRKRLCEEYARRGAYMGDRK